jgi:dodecin
MSVAKITELSSASDKGFEDAIEQGIKRASKTLEGVSGAWISELKVDIKNGKITRYRVNMRVTFVLKE